MKIAADQAAYDQHIRERRDVARIKADKAAQIERNRQAARQRGRSISDTADDRRQRIAAAAEDYRSGHPYNRARYGTRRMARDLAAELGESYNTVRGILRSLGIH